MFFMEYFNYLAFAIWVTVIHIKNAISNNAFFAYMVSTRKSYAIDKTSLAPKIDADASVLFYFSFDSWLWQPGDYVRFRSTDSFDHSIVITNIEGNKVYYTDANIDGNNSIRWNASMTKVTLANYFNKQLLWNKYNTSYIASFANGYGVYGCVIHRNGFSVKSLTQSADTEEPVISNVQITDVN